MSKQIQSVRGTRDILPNSTSAWRFVENIFQQVSEQFYYQEIRTPIFEYAEIFSRTIGENTDVVGKEMYAFPDRDNELLALRPESTAGVVRAVVQHSLAAQGQLQRLCYIGPQFRYERPQKGRYRQFFQCGAECFSSDSPLADVEIILYAYSVLKNIGINDFSLQINSLGSSDCRANYRTELIQYFLKHETKLSQDSKNRLHKNPLRILDSKSNEDIDVIKDAPKFSDFMSTESKERFSQVLSLLDACKIPYSIQPTLVRGLDYYSHTVFEFIGDGLGAQSALGGGGRYNDMFEYFGGDHTPSVGFSLGMDRIMLVLESIRPELFAPAAPNCYIAAQNAESDKVIQTLALQLRNGNLSVVTDVQRRSLKAQMREANKIGATTVIVIGEIECESKTATIKVMKDGTSISAGFSEIHKTINEIILRQNLNNSVEL